jgi:hypothetical protein
MEIASSGSNHYDRRPPMIRVTAVKPLDNYRLELAFGSIAWPHDQDFGPESLYAESHPMQSA